MNPVKGLCPVACSYCYARRLYKRFGWNPEIRIDQDWWRDIAVLRKPSRIFIGSTMELFGDWVEPAWMDSILGYCHRLHWHTFIFLTKRPERLAEWQFPDNCWVGVTATDQREVCAAVNNLFDHRVAKRQFLSIEPLLSWDTSQWHYPFASTISKKDLDLIIIGQQTPVSKATTPKLEWIMEIVDAADKAGVKVFLKDNLRPLLKLDHALMGQAALDAGLLNWAGGLRQQLPGDEAR